MVPIACVGACEERVERGKSSRIQSVRIRTCIQQSAEGSEVASVNGPMERIIASEFVEFIDVMSLRNQLFHSHNIVFYFCPM